MPRATPSSRSVLFMLDALPWSGSGVADSTTVAIGARAMPIPMPPTMNGGTNVE